MRSRGGKSWPKAAPSLCRNVHFAVNVDEPHLVTGPSVGQPFMIDAEQVQHRGVQVIKLLPMRFVIFSTSSGPSYVDGATA